MKLLFFFLLLEGTTGQLYFWYHSYENQTFATATFGETRIAEWNTTAKFWSVDPEFNVTILYFSPPFIFKKELTRIAGMLQAFISCTEHAFHYALNGSDFISYDDSTKKWVTGQDGAMSIKDKWTYEGTVDSVQSLFINCESAQLPTRRPETPPQVTLHKRRQSRWTTRLTCNIFGFYPKNITATWNHGGRDCLYETLRKEAAPNTDGTFYLQLAIEIEPGTHDEYCCIVSQKQSSTYQFFAPHPPELPPPQTLARHHGLIVSGVLLLVLCLLLRLARYSKKKV